MKNEHPIDWKRFCIEPGCTLRYDIDKPWVYDGYKYATDGRAMIRSACSEPDTTEGRFPDVTAFPWAKDGDFIPWPAPLEEQEACVCCMGHGKIFDEDEFGNTLPSGETCRICKGNKAVNYPRRTSMNGRLFNQPCMVLVSTLPGVFYVDGKIESDDEPLKFIFDGGEGLVMSTTDKQESEK